MHSAVPGQQIKKLNLCIGDILSTNEFRLFSIRVLYNRYQSVINIPNSVWKKIIFN